MSGADVPAFCSAMLPPDYCVLEHLRRGAILDVYHVWSQERACGCVAKVLRPERLADARARQRLLREGRLLLRLSHPHIVRAYSVVTAPGPAVILETLTGATLGNLLAHHPRGLSTQDVAVLGAQLCSAIQYLHSKDMLHLDLKPSNIVCERGVAKVLDLDIARPPGRGPRQGTREYMAPEQIRGEAVAAATDVWSVGVVLFEAATGRSPFRFDPDERTYPQLTRRADSLPIRSGREVLSEMIDAALQPAPEDRPSVREFGDRLRALAGEAEHASPAGLASGPANALSVGAL